MSTLYARQLAQVATAAGNDQVGERVLAGAAAHDPALQVQALDARGHVFDLVLAEETFEVDTQVGFFALARRHPDQARIEEQLRRR